MSDRVTSRGTVKGHHPKPEDEITEGGVAPSPKADHGSPKPSASKAAVEEVPDADASTATAGKLEKQQAAAAGAQKEQSGRGHRK